MHLVSRIAQRVLIDGYEVAFDEGESIHTENSHKYDDASLAALAEAGDSDRAPLDRQQRLLCGPADGGGVGGHPTPRCDPERGLQSPT